MGTSEGDRLPASEGGGRHGRGRVERWQGETHGRERRSEAKTADTLEQSEGARTGMVSHAGCVLQFPTNLRWVGGTSTCGPSLTL